MAAELFKSVHITNFYHKNSGGISTSYNNLLAAASKRRQHVRLIVPGETESVVAVNDFAKIYYVPAKRSPLFDRRYRIMMPWQYMLHGSIIRNILLAEMPDMIEVTDKYTLSWIGPMIRKNLFRRLGRPMLVHFSCERMDDNICTFLGGGKFGKWLSGLLIGSYHLPAFDFHLANSDYTAAEFFDAVDRSCGSPRKWFRNRCRSFFRAPTVPLEDRVFVCPRGVDLESFNVRNHSSECRDEICRKAGVPNGATLLLYAGRLSPEKNIGLLSELMQLLSHDKTHDYRLLIAGDGPKAKWLTGQTTKIAPGKVVQLGHVKKTQLASLYANCDVFVHPNPREPFGIAPLEAMASGLPMVAPNSGGILSYATHENAWLVEPTPSSFAAAIRDIVENDAEREEKLRKASIMVRQHSCERSAERLLETYDRLYKEFQSRRSMFTGERLMTGSALAKVINFILIAATTYFIRLLDFDCDPAAYFGLY